MELDLTEALGGVRSKRCGQLGSLGGPVQITGHWILKSLDCC